MAVRASACVLAMIDALARRQPVCFDHHRQIELEQRIARFFCAVRGSKACGRNSRAQHQLLSECLARFQARRGSRRTDDPPSLGAKLIHDAGRERSFPVRPP